MIKDFHRVGALTPDRAARIILSGIKKGKKVIQFPISQVLMTRIQDLFPVFAYDKIPVDIQKGEDYLNLYIHADGPISGNTFYNEEENTLWLYLPDAAFESPSVLHKNNTPHTLVESMHYIDDISDLKFKFTLKITDHQGGSYIIPKDESKYAFKKIEKRELE